MSSGAGTQVNHDVMIACWLGWGLKNIFFCRHCNGRHPFVLFCALFWKIRVFFGSKIYFSLGVGVSVTNIFWCRYCGGRHQCDFKSFVLPTCFGCWDWWPFSSYSSFVQCTLISSVAWKERFEENNTILIKKKHLIFEMKKKMLLSIIYLL